MENRRIESFANARYNDNIACCSETIAHILEKAEYCGHTVNFRTHVKSYKNKKRVDNPKEDWLIFENTHEAIISQQEFDLVQELR